MRYYLVAAIDGEDGLEADVPAGTNWAGNTDGQTYLIATPNELDLPALSSEALEQACHELGLKLEDVLSWRVG